MPLGRVVHVTTVHSLNDARIYRKECRTLSRAGYEVSIVGPGEAREIIGGVEICAVQPPKNRLERMLITTRRVYDIAARKSCDLYHLHDPELVVLGLLLRARRRKVIYDIHEDLPSEIFDKDWIPSWLQPIVSFATRLFPILCGWAMNGIISATPAIAAAYPREKTVVVQNFPASEEFVIEEPGDYLNRCLVAVNIDGGMSELRGISEMVEAIGLLPADIQPKLLLIGKFDPPNLEQKMAKLRGWDRVDFRGWQSEVEVASLLRRARVGLVLFHPAQNHFYSQPTKLFEYMAAGIPVVISDFARWREIVEGARCGIVVDPLKPKEIAQAVQWLFVHAEEAEKMGQRGREAILKQYNWRNEAEKLLEIYQRILQS